VDHCIGIASVIVQARADQHSIPGPPAVGHRSWSAGACSHYSAPGITQLRTAAASRRTPSFC